MNETANSIDSTGGLITFIRTVESPVKIQKKGAQIILNNLSEHRVQLFGDKDAKLYLCMEGKEAEETTFDDVVDLVCEYNYEEIYQAEEAVKAESDFVHKCKTRKKLEELKKDKWILDKIFYQTKYGRKVWVVADRICTGLCEKFNLVPVYNIPMYENQIVSEEAAYGTAVKAGSAEHPKEGQHNETQEDAAKEDAISDDHIVASDKVDIKQESFDHDKEEAKGAR